MTPIHRCLRVVPLPAEVSACDALALYRHDPYVALLESQGPTSRQARYSFLCVDPFLVFRSKRGESFVGPPGDLRRCGRDPFAELAALMRRYGGTASGWSPDLPPFLGGAVGYLGYEMLYLLVASKVPDAGRDDFHLPDAYLTFCRTVIATDRVSGRSWVATNGTGSTPGEAAADADASSLTTVRTLESAARRPDVDATRLKARRAAIVNSRRLSDDHLLAAHIHPVVTHDRYLEIIRAAKEHILAGDIFEVCVSQRFDTDFFGEGESLYRTLRAVNEAPFASYLRFPELEVVSSSPERFLSLDRERWVESRPIKGTRPRGATPEEDAARISDLATCAKDHAENVMIVDVARNDLGKVCEFGSISVPELRIIESYPFTHQLVSTVRGRLRRTVEPVDLIRAAFPGGSMTGAPKLEAMRIIDNLEPVKRGVFAGAIGYLDFDGSLDLAIAIRTFLKTGDNVSLHVGGAIVDDSDPEEEYQETLDKAHALVTALELAREEL